MSGIIELYKTHIDPNPSGADIHYLFTSFGLNIAHVSDPLNDYVNKANEKIRAENQAACKDWILKNSKFNAKKASEAQIKLCTENHFPLFAPRDGECYSCKRNIYEEINDRGISVDKASSEHVTGCPHCLRSFCD